MRVSADAHSSCFTFAIACFSSFSDACFSTSFLYDSFNFCASFFFFSAASRFATSLTINSAAASALATACSAIVLNDWSANNFFSSGVRLSTGKWKIRFTCSRSACLRSACFFLYIYMDQVNPSTTSWLIRSCVKKLVFLAWNNECWTRWLFTHLASCLLVEYVRGTFACPNFRWNAISSFIRLSHAIYGPRLPFLLFWPSFDLSCAHEGFVFFLFLDPITSLVAAMAAICSSYRNLSAASSPLAVAVGLFVAAFIPFLLLVVVVVGVITKYWMLI